MDERGKVRALEDKVLAHQPTARQFQAQRQVLDARTTSELVHQQRLFRLFQALQTNKRELAENVVSQGVSLDELLWDETHRISVPGANRFVQTVAVPNQGSELAAVTLLTWAAAEGRLDDVNWLLDHGATASMRLPGGRDAAWLAMEKGQWEVYETLMTRGVYPDLRLEVEPRLSRLMGAALSRQVPIVAHLISTRRVTIDQFDEAGRTALHHSLRQQPYTQEDLEITRLLLAAGADAYFTDNDGVNPVDHAIQEAQLALMNELGVDLSMQNPVPAPEPEEPAFEAGPSGPAPGPRPQRPSGPGHRPR